MSTLVAQQQCLPGVLETTLVAQQQSVRIGCGRPPGFSVIVSPSGVRDHTSGSVVVSASGSREPNNEVAQWLSVCLSCGRPTTQVAKCQSVHLSCGRPTLEAQWQSICLQVLETTTVAQWLSVYLKCGRLTLVAQQ